MNLLQPVFVREHVIRSTRDYFSTSGFHEVITPTMNAALPVEPNIYPFSTQWIHREGTKEFFLSTSPESGLKKMIAKGIGNCFAIGKCFRNLEGAGSLHLPEFLMLEWYREHAKYTKIMEDTQEYVLYVKKQIDTLLDRAHSTELSYQGMTIDLTGSWPVFSLIDLFKIHAQLDFHEILEDDVLFRKAQEKGYNTEHATWVGLFDQIFVNEIESQLPKTPFFLIDFPTRISPLCTVKKDNPHVAERFEFFMFGMEIANGNTENSDYKAVEEKFIREQKNRKDHNLLNSPIDYDFIHALKTMAESGKEYAGIGLGIDRLAMIMADVNDIKEIELLVR